MAEYAERWANDGKVVIIAALDGTFQRRPFNAILLLIPLAEEARASPSNWSCLESGIAMMGWQSVSESWLMSQVIKLRAVCACRREAAFTHRLGQEQDVEVRMMTVHCMGTRVHVPRSPAAHLMAPDRVNAAAGCWRRRELCGSMQTVLPGADQCQAGRQCCGQAGQVWGRQSEPTAAGCQVCCRNALILPGDPHHGIAGVCMTPRWCLLRSSNSQPVRRSTRRAAALQQQAGRAKQESPAAEVDRAVRRLSALTLR